MNLIGVNMVRQPTPDTQRYGYCPAEERKMTPAVQETGGVITL